MALRTALAVAPLDDDDDPFPPFFFPVAAIEEDEGVVVVTCPEEEDGARSRLDRQTSGPNRNFGLLFELVDSTVNAESGPEFSAWKHYCK